MTEYNVKRTDIYSPQRRQPEFYVKADSIHTLVAEVDDGHRTLFIYVDGKMKYELFRKPDIPPGIHIDGQVYLQKVILSYEDWEGTRVQTDDSLDKALASEDLYLINNPWFDIYDEGGASLDYPGFDIDESIFQAGVLLEELREADGRN